MNAPRERRGRRQRTVVVALAAGLLVLLMLSLGVGRVPVSPVEIVRILASSLLGLDGDAGSPLSRMVLLEIRLPRVVAAVLIGAGLSASGAAYQGVFRNPLVSPDILGVSAGAGLGAAIAILLSLPTVGIQLLSFVFALLAVGVSSAIGLRCQQHRSGILGLILGGIVVGSVFTSFLSLSKLVADPENKLPAITFWLMGSLAAVTPRDLLVLALPMLVAGVVLFRVRWYINVLSFGDDEARSLGADVRRVRAIVVLASTVMTACAISVCGIVGWIGLMAPHISRMLVGPNYRILLPTSLLVGGGVLVLVDDLARSLTTTEVPLGILTSLIGGPFFVWLMLRSARQWD